MQKLHNTRKQILRQQDKNDKEMQDGDKPI